MKKVFLVIGFYTIKYLILMATANMYVLLNYIIDDDFSCLLLHVIIQVLFIIILTLVTYIKLEFKLWYYVGGFAFLSIAFLCFCPEGLYLIVPTDFFFSGSSNAEMGNLVSIEVAIIEFIVIFICFLIKQIVKKVKQKNTNPSAAQD